MSTTENTNSGLSEIPGLGNAQVPFMEVMQLSAHEDEETGVEFRLTVADRHLRSFGILHGGVMATMLDTALGQVAGAAAPEGHHVVTVQFNMNLIRPACKGELLTAKGELQHRGSKTAVTRGELRNQDDKLIASATGTFMYLPLPEDVKPEKS